jgi:hypothetical protein
MGMRIEKSGYDPEDGFLYYVIFKPSLELGDESVSTRMPVSAAVSVTETGELADLVFELPKQCRNDEALHYIRGDNAAEYVEPRVFIVVPGSNGDTAVSAAAKLDLDVLGRIVGMEIQWNPDQMHLAIRN